MKAKNKLLTLLILSAGATAAIAAVNKFIKLSATSQNLLSDPQSQCYKWRLGNIHYTKTGIGKPLLLIHDLNASSSSFEWSQVISQLSEHYTVYTVDLLGCGRSEKPNMTYTNYLYVQLISDFIKSVIGHRTNVIATGESASIPIMACANNSDLFDQIMLINPLSLHDYSQMPGKMSKYYKIAVDFPVIGTLIYHISSSRQAIAEELTMKKFLNPYSVKSNWIDSSYESAHLGSSPKSVYSSVKCNFTKCNIVNALRKIDNSIYLIGGESVEDIADLLNEYKTFNPSIESTTIANTKYLPQLEAPGLLLDFIYTYLG